MRKTTCEVYLSTKAPGFDGDSAISNLGSDTTRNTFWLSPHNVSVFVARTTEIVCTTLALESGASSVLLHWRLRKFCKAHYVSRTKVSMISAP